MTTETDNQTQSTASQIAPETQNPLEGVNQTTFCVNEDEGLCIELEDRIRLYFLRYGLFAKHLSEEHIEIPESKDGVNENLTIEGAPVLENFYVGRTTLNSGYIYMFDAKDENGYFYEYKLHIDGRHAVVYDWVKEHENREENGRLKDIRESSGVLEMNKHFTEGDQLWIGYSQVQWTADYHETMRIAKDAEKEAAGMVKVNCEAFTNGSSQEHAIRYEDVKITFREDQKGSVDWMEYTLSALQEYDRQNKPEVKKDLFVTLPDPIGCAMDITMATSAELMKHRANIEGMKTATDPDTIYEAMQSDGGSSMTGREDQEAMFTLALSAYQMVYNDDDAINQYDGGDISTSWWEKISAGIAGGSGATMPSGYEEIMFDKNGINKQKLENVLGVIERKQQRELINKVRLDLKTYLFHEYYINAYHHHVLGDALAKIDGKFSILQPFEILYINPHDIDRSLDLNDAYEEDTVVMSQLFINDLEDLSGTNLYKVLDEEVNITEIMIQEHATILVNTGVVLDKLVSLFGKPVLGGIPLKVLNDITEQISKINIGGQNIITMQTRQVQLHSPSTPRLIMPVNQLIVTGVSEQLYTSKYSWSSSTSGSLIGIEVPRSSPLPQIPTGIVPGTTTHALIGGIRIPLGVFKSFLIGVQLINFRAAINALSEDFSARNSLNLLGAALGTFDAIIEYRKAIGNLRPDTTLSKVGSYAGKASGYITVLVSVWDAIIRARARDHDSSIAYAISALAAGAAIVATVFLGVAIAILFTVIALGFSILAVFLKDTPLAAFFKHFAFSDRIPSVQNSLPAWQHNQLFYQARDIQSSFPLSGVKSFENLSNFRDDIAALTNIVTQAKAIITPLSVLTSTPYANSFSVIFEINSILRSAAQNIEIKAVYDMGNHKRVNAASELQITPPILLPSNDIGSTKVSTQITIPEDFLLRYNSGPILPSSSMMILFKFKLDQNNSFPPKFSDGKRYYYAVSQPLMTGIGSEKTKNVEIIALEDLAEISPNIEIQTDDILKSTLRNEIPQIDFSNF